MACITPSLEGEVWLKSIKFPFLNRVVECVDYEEIERRFRGGVWQIQGRNVPVATVDKRSSREFTLTVATGTLAQARDMDLILASNQIMFVQVPFEDPAACQRVSAVPGGYVAIGTTVQSRAFQGSQINVWELPCTVVAAPGVDVVGATMIWADVLATYGSWTALINSNPTWRDLLEGVSSPDDLVVL